MRFYMTRDIDHYCIGMRYEKEMFDLGFGTKDNPKDD